MTSMLSKVAKAIFDAMDVTDGLDGTSAERYALAAIVAMREPTDVMIEACKSYRDRDSQVRDYQAMIDGAL